MFIPSKSNTTMRLLSAAAFMLASASASAYDWSDGFDFDVKQGDTMNLVVSPYTMHYTNDPKHKYVWALGVERERASSQLSGAAFFSNSFGQPCVYLFPFGEIYRDLLGNQGMYAKWTGGLLYGYTGKYENKVPLNYNGFSPAIVPSLGWEFDGGKQVQVNLLGAAAIQLQASIPFKW